MKKILVLVLLCCLAVPCATYPHEPKPTLPDPVAEPDINNKPAAWPLYVWEIYCSASTEMAKMNGEHAGVNPIEEAASTEMVNAQQAIAVQPNPCPHDPEHDASDAMYYGNFYMGLADSTYGSSLGAEEDAISEWNSGVEEYHLIVHADADEHDELPAGTWFNMFNYFNDCVLEASGAAMGFNVAAQFYDDAYDEYDDAENIATTCANASQ